MIVHIDENLAEKVRAEAQAQDRKLSGVFTRALRVYFGGGRRA